MLMCDLSYISLFDPFSQSTLDQERLVDRALKLLQRFEPYTAAHSDRVGRLAGIIDAELGLSKTEVSLIRASGQLHDIGKVEISLDYLQKPSALSDDEYQEVKRHPELGAQLISKCPALLELMPGVLHHHEWFNGRGYPFGLRGDRIPFVARVIAVADAYDAMTSTRSYRRALPHQVALDELVMGSDTQFDPQVVSAAVSASLDHETDSQS